MKTDRYQFEKYEIVSEIGHGGNATVYQAIQKNLDRTVALKVLLPALVNDQGYLERFHLEARSIAKLRHPNIVTIYDEGNEQGAHFIAMELLEGKDLHHLVKEKGSLPIHEAVEMARCIAGALDYAHTHGIIHRDVKSSNIFMTAARCAVLTDFGIAQSGITSVQIKSGAILGTPEFMSPEQAAGKPIDSRSDFYSLGVVLFHALSGHYPFQGESPITTIQKILYEDPVPLGTLVMLPPALVRVIERCLVKDPDKRVKDGKELIELLNESTVRGARHPSKRPAPHPSGQPVPDPAPGEEDGPATCRVPQAAAQRSVQPRVRRRAPLVRTVVVAAVACVMLTGYVTWQRGLKVRTTHPETATVAPAERRPVPYLIGATKDEAISLLVREGFEVGGVHAVAVPNPANRGKVDTQRPAYGTTAAPGTTVDLLIGE